MPQRTERRTLRRLAQAATLASAAFILYATLAPSTSSGGVPDWLVHLLLFLALGLAASLWYATSDAARAEPRRMLAMVIVAMWLFGGLTEFTQQAVGRDPSMSDLGYDVLGSVAGFLGGGALWRGLLERGRR